MKKIFIMLTVLFTILIGSNACTESNGETRVTELSETPALPDRISSLPECLTVETDGSPIVHAEKHNSASFQYIWPHKVIVKSSDKEVKIVEYGVFTLIDGEWVDSTEDGKPYDAALFEKWFTCPDAKLESNKQYESDYFDNVGSFLPKENRVMRWYFIGESDEGKCRGEITLMDVNSEE